MCVIRPRNDDADHCRYRYAPAGSGGEMERRDVHQQTVAPGAERRLQLPLFVVRIGPVPFDASGTETGSVAA